MSVAVSTLKCSKEQRKCSDLGTKISTSSGFGLNRVSAPVGAAASQVAVSAAWAVACAFWSKLTHLSRARHSQSLVDAFAGVPPTNAFPQ
jgi:hypothetical protein